MSDAGMLILIMIIAVLAPLLAYGVSRWFPIPLVIFEILLGILIGPDVLGWVDHGDKFIDMLSELGLTMLIFLAGYEIDYEDVRGDTLRRAVRAWLVSLVAGLAFAFAISGEADKTFVIGTALTSTALGTVLPILRDSGDLRGRFGVVMLAFGAVGEFGPIIAMALLLGGRSAGESTALLVGFAAITALAVVWALRPRPPWFSDLIAKTLHSSGQFAVRFVMLVLALMLGLSQVFGLDVLLGAFAAGIITRLVLHGAAPESSEEVVGKVEAMGFGFLVPLFFIVTGIEFDLAALLDGGRSLVLLPIFLVLFLLVRGVPLYLFAPRDLERDDRRALVLFGSTCLPLVVAITTIGVDGRIIGSGEAAALVGAAMISVLVFPLLGLKLRARSTGGMGRPSRTGESAEAW